MSHGSGRVGYGYDVHGYGHARFYPYGTRFFTILEREPFYFCMFLKIIYDEAIAVWHVKTVFYWEPITVYLLIFSTALLTIKKHLIQYGMKGCGLL